MKSVIGNCDIQADCRKLILTLETEGLDRICARYLVHFLQQTFENGLCHFHLVSEYSYMSKNTKRCKIENLLSFFDEFSENDVLMSFLIFGSPKNGTTKRELVKSINKSLKFLYPDNSMNEALFSIGEIYELVEQKLQCNNILPGFVYGADIFGSVDIFQLDNLYYISFVFEIYGFSLEYRLEKSIMDMRGYLQIIGQLCNVRYSSITYDFYANVHEKYHFNTSNSMSTKDRMKYLKTYAPIMMLPYSAYDYLGGNIAAEKNQINVTVSKDERYVWLTSSTALERLTIDELKRIKNFYSPLLLPGIYPIPPMEVRAYGELLCENKEDICVYLKTCRICSVINESEKYPLDCYSVVFKPFKMLPSPLEFQQLTVETFCAQ